MHSLQPLHNVVVPLLQVLHRPLSECLPVPPVCHDDEAQVEPAGKVHQMVSLLPAPLRAGQVLGVLHLSVGGDLHNLVEPVRPILIFVFFIQLFL